MKQKEIPLYAGADYIICHQNEDFAEKVNELTNGEGVDVILDSISGTVSERSLKCLAYYGRPFISVMLVVKLAISNERFTCKLPFYTRF